MTNGKISQKKQMAMGKKVTGMKTGGKVAPAVQKVSAKIAQGPKKDIGKAVKSSVAKVTSKTFKKGGMSKKGC